MGLDIYGTLSNYHSRCPAVAITNPMTDDLNRLAKSLDQGAPDAQVAEQMRLERDLIEASLKAVGEYVLSDEKGRIYVITPAEKITT
jgi:hypothetical protein